MRPPCPKCRTGNSLRVNDDGPYCITCGWRETVTACGRCLCPTGECVGHFAGNSEKKDRTVRPCDACEQVVEEATV